MPPALPAASMASSVSREKVSVPQIFRSDTSGPSVSPRLTISANLEYAASRSATSSRSVVNLSRKPGSSNSWFAAAKTCKRCSAYWDCLGLPRKMRSKLNSALAIVQPLFSSPTRFSLGTRTLSRKTSQNSSCPAILRIGRTVMPGWSKSTSKKLIPSCFLPSLLVRTRRKIWLASCASVVHVFWPLTIK